MDPIISFLLLLASLAIRPPALAARSIQPTARITVVGAVYCDTCLSNSFSRSSYFLPGADVLIKCKFGAKSPKSASQMNFHVNKTTDKYGMYKLEIPSVDGVNCISGFALKSMCQATLIGSSSSACNVPALRTTADEISVKSKQDNLCIYNMNALSFRPPKKNLTLCGNRKVEGELVTSFNSSKFFLPYFPPYGFFPWPQLPPFSSLPFPPLPPSPFFAPIPIPIPIPGPTVFAFPIPTIPSGTEPFFPKCSASV